MKAAIFAVCLVALAPPAIANSPFDYGWGMADAHVPMGDTFFNVWVQKTRNTILLEPSVKTALVGGGHYPDTTWRTVAEAFVQPVGCGISEVRPLLRIGAAWEATYVCPDGVDLRSLVKSQRPLLQHGAKLHG